MSETRIGLTLPRPVTMLVAGFAVAGLAACSSEQGTTPDTIVQHAIDPDGAPDPEPTNAVQEDPGTGLSLQHHEDTLRVEARDAGKESTGEFPSGLEQGIYLLPRELPLCDALANPDVFEKAANTMQAFDGSLTPDSIAEDGECRAYSSVIDNLQTDKKMLMFVAEVYPKPQEQVNLSLPYVEYGIYNEAQVGDPSIPLLPVGQVECDLPNTISEPYGLTDESYVATTIQNVDPAVLPRESDMYGMVAETVNGAAETMCQALGGTVTRTNLGLVPLESGSGA